MAKSRHRNSCLGDSATRRVGQYLGYRRVGIGQESIGPGRDGVSICGLLYPPRRDSIAGTPRGDGVRRSNGRKLGLGAGVYTAGILSPLPR